VAWVIFHPFSGDLPPPRPLRALSVRRCAPDHVHSHLVGHQLPRRRRCTPSTRSDAVRWGTHKGS